MVKNRKVYWLLGLLALFLGLMYLTVWILLPDVHQVADYFKSLGSSGRWLFLGAAALAATVSLPRQFIAIAAGMVFGWIEGLILCSLGVMTGNAVHFFFSRLLLRPVLKKHFADKLAMFDGFIKLGPFRMVLMLRLLPAGNSSLINLAAGGSALNPLTFLSASYLGQLPQSIIFSLAGSGLNVDPALRISVAAILFVISLGLGFGLYRRYKIYFPKPGIF